MALNALLLGLLGGAPAPVQATITSINSIGTMDSNSGILSSSFARSGFYDACATSDGICDPLKFGESVTSIPSLNAGDAVRMFVRFRGCTNAESITTPGQSCTTYNSAFYPKVDDYSLLFLPNSSLQYIIRGGANRAEEGWRNVSVALYYGGQMLTLPWRTWSARPQPFGGDERYLNGRTVLIQLNNGKIKSFGWAPTACTGSLNCKCIQNTCFFPVTKVDGTANPVDITIYVGWTGTDSSGRSLTSYSRDIYRFTNAFAG